MKDNTGEDLQDLTVEVILDKTQKALTTKKKKDKFDYIKIPIHQRHPYESEEMSH